MIELQRTQLRNLVVHDSNEWNPVRGSEVWSLNLDQIEPSTGRILKKEMTAPEKLGPSTFPFEAGTVLYSKLRPYLNKVVVAQSNGVATTELVPVRCHPEKVFPEYLAYYLRSPKFLSFASNAVAGAKMPRMVMSDFWAHEVPTPPLPEQRRIATILDQAEALRAKRRQALALLDELAQAVFVEMFGDPVTNPKKWERIPLDQLICRGPQNGLYKPSTDYGSGAPILRIDSFYDGVVTKLAELKRVRITPEEQSLYGLAPGDIVVNRVNSIELLGKSAIIPELQEPTVFESNMMRLTVDVTRIRPEYLVTFLQSSWIKAQIANAAKRAVNQASINQTDVRSFVINVPPLALQSQFTQRLAAIDRLKSAHRAALTQLDALFASLQHRAFAGLL